MLTFIICVNRRVLGWVQIKSGSAIKHDPWHLIYIHEVVCLIEYLYYCTILYVLIFNAENLCTTISILKFKFKLVVSEAHYLSFLCSIHYRANVHFIIIFLDYTFVLILNACSVMLLTPSIYCIQTPLHYRTHTLTRTHTHSYAHSYNHIIIHMHFRTPLLVVIGRQIPCPKIQDPSAELVHEFQVTYLKELKRLRCTYENTYRSPHTKEAWLITGSLRVL